MLRRVIGEDIELELAFERHPLPVEVDPARIDQVLMNLAVNARDAMPHGGRLTIATAAVDADEAAGDRLVRPSHGGRHGDRHGRGHGPGDEGADLRALLHDEGARARGRAWASRPSFGIVNQAGG